MLFLYVIAFVDEEGEQGIEGARGAVHTEAVIDKVDISVKIGISFLNLCYGRSSLFGFV